MKYGYTVKKNGVTYAPGMEVPGDEPAKVDLTMDEASKVELTDEVPEGALEPNADGSINTYDEDGNIAGTLSPEEIEELQNEAIAAFEEPEKPKRGRKQKEA